MNASSPFRPGPGVAPPEQRFGEICDELSELCGQQNAIAGRITELLAEVGAHDDRLLGGRGLRSLEHFCTWQLGVSSGRAKQLTAIARRRDELPECAELLRAGSLSEDQVGAIAARAPAGTDAHYAELARSATVSQLRTALRVAPRPEPASDAPPAPRPPERHVSAQWDDEGTWSCRIRLPESEGAVAEASLSSHLDALVNEWKRDRDDAPEGVATPPFPTLADAFVRMCELGLDAEAQRRPHGHRTTVVVHLDVESQVGAFHLGPVLSEAERRYLCCDARFEVWFERDGVPLGVGRTTREIPRRLRRALEHRARGACEVPGCGATRGLHAHHVRHWEDGGPTELHNLLLLCPFHHRSHHRGLITIRGTGDDVEVLDRHGRPLSAGGLARPPTTDPLPAARYQHPTGERFEYKWYEPPTLS